MLSRIVQTLFIFCILFNFAFALEIESKEKKAIDKFIRNQAMKVRGFEYPEYRRYLKGDVGSDGVQDIVVLYTIEEAQGGNSWLQYLVVFQESKSGIKYLHHLRVGGKGMRSVDLETIDEGMIKLKTKHYGLSDALCCPSVSGNTHIFINGKFLEEGSQTIDCNQKEIK